MGNRSRILIVSKGLISLLLKGRKYLAFRQNSSSSANKKSNRGLISNLDVTHLQTCEIDNGS